MMTAQELWDLQVMSSVREFTTHKDMDFVTVIGVALAAHHGANGDAQRRS